MQSPCRHQCLIYQGSPSRNLPALVSLLKQKLEKNYRCLHLDSPPMIAGFRSYLAAAGIDVARESNQGRLVLSADQRHLVDGHFDVESMMHTLQTAVDQALQDGFSGLWATGDMTWEFGPKANFSKLMEYECRLEEFIRQQPAFSGICLYHADTLPREAMLDGVLAHESFFVNDTLSRMNPHFVPPGSQAPRASRAAVESTLDELCRSQEPS